MVSALVNMSAEHKKPASEGAAGGGADAESKDDQGKVEKGLDAIQNLEKQGMAAKWRFDEDLAYEVTTADGASALPDGRTASAKLPPGLVSRKCQRAMCCNKESAEIGAKAFAKCAKCGAPYCTRECQVCANTP